MEKPIDTNLDLFNPKKAELQEAAAKFKDLKINGIDDKTGYKLVHEAQMTLRGFRTNIQKTRLAYTKQFDEAKAKAMGLEKELLSIITPIEEALKEQKEAIDAEKERIRQEEEEKKRKFIQDRVDILKQYEFFDFDFYSIGQLSEDGFKELAEKKKIEFEEKQAKLKLEKRDNAINHLRTQVLNAETLDDIFKIEESMRGVESMEGVEFNIGMIAQDIISKKKSLEAEEKLKEAQKIIDERNAKIEREAQEKKRQDEIQAAKDEGERQAKEKLEKEEKERKDKEESERIEKEAKEKEEQERLEKEKKYQDFLKKHEGNFDKIVKEDGKIILYKKIDEFII